MWNALNCWCHLFKEVKTAVRCKGRERVVTKSGNQPVNRGQRLGEQSCSQLLSSKHVFEIIYNLVGKRLVRDKFRNLT